MNAIFIGLMLAGKRPRVFGSGEQVRDYVYVDDVVSANVIALARADGEILNLGDRNSDVGQRHRAAS